MSTADGLRTELVSAVAPAVSLAFLLEPPGWTRLEPQSVSGDPLPGLEARVHDPLWLLTRQWQLGEFQAEDVGSPVSVQVTVSTSELSAFQPGDPEAGLPVRGWRPGELIEPLVEREPASARGPGLVQRAQSGAQLITELREAGVGAWAVQALVRACPLALPWADPAAPDSSGLIDLLSGRLPDPEKVADRMSLDSGTPVLPSWFDHVPDPDAALNAALDWHRWYRATVAPLPDPTHEAWVEDRLEYRFSLGTTTSSGPQVLRAPAFGGGRVSWYDVDLDAEADPLVVHGAAPPPGPTTRTQTLLATPLRYSGMPAERYWEFEDGQVNLGALQVQPHDLARLALVEFAMIYGNDWIVVPVDAPHGSFLVVEDLRCTTSFGEAVAVPPLDDSTRSGLFRMFETSTVVGDGTVPGLLVLPSAAATLEGQLLEEVLFMRDEVANLSWAVERIVQGPDGRPRSRTDEPRPAPLSPSQDEGADMDYQLQNEVPDWWIPMVPIATGYATTALRKGAMVKHGAPVLPLGVTLAPGRPLTLQDEEVPREGIRVRRTPTLARRADGTYVSWTSRRVRVGRGEGASGLAFDSAVRRRPPAP